jgi:hypothetical protein
MAIEGTPLGWREKAFLMEVVSCNNHDQAIKDRTYKKSRGRPIGVRFGETSRFALSQRQLRR